VSNDLLIVAVTLGGLAALALAVLAVAVKQGWVEGSVTLRITGLAKRRGRGSGDSVTAGSGPAPDRGAE
jgi:hypothetical protein